jgi:hypothetical protein
MYIAALWALRRTFGPKKDEVIAGWRKLHNEELFPHWLCSRARRENQIRNVRFPCQKHYAARRKVVGSIPNDLIGFLQFT